MPDASLKIRAVVNIKERLVNEPFKPTITSDHQLSFSSSLSTISEDSGSIATNVWNFVVSSSGANRGVGLHLAVWMENVTHPAPAAGVVPLPKEHYDAALTDLELTNAAAIEDKLLSMVQIMQKRSEY